MRKLVWIGDPYFYESLSACGWEQSACLPEAGDVPWNWQSITRETGFEPDALVAAGACAALGISGLETLPCLTLFYEPALGLASFSPPLAQAFDAAFVVHRQNVASLAGSFMPARRVHWLPAYAMRPAEAPLTGPRPAACLFVERRCSPKLRSPFAKGFSRLPFVAPPSTPAWLAEISSSQTVVLEPESGELGFGFFEALASGACVLSPRVENGLESLFVDGEHFVGFAPGDVGDAAYRVEFLLQDQELIDYIGRTGWEEVRARHLAANRAQEMTDIVCDMAIEGAEALIRDRCAQAEAILHRELMPARDLAREQGAHFGSAGLK